MLIFKRRLESCKINKEKFFQVLVEIQRRSTGSSTARATQDAGGLKEQKNHDAFV